MLVASAAASAAHKALNPGSEFFGPGFLNELVDLGLLLAVMFITSLSDRELFGWTVPKHERSKHRSDIA